MKVFIFSRLKKYDITTLLNLSQSNRKKKDIILKSNFLAGMIVVRFDFFNIFIDYFSLILETAWSCL